MRCSLCKSKLSWQDALTGAQIETYQCPKCSTRSTPKYGWKLLLILALIGAPLLEFVVQFALETLGENIPGAAILSKDEITLLSMGSTAVVLVVLYYYLRGFTVQKSAQSENNRK